MKFSAGKPRLPEIRDHIASEWQWDTPPAVGYLDPRHVTLHMASVADTNMALASTTNKINNSLFRLFRWTPDFKLGKESSFVAVWVKFFNLPLHYYNTASLCRLGSLLGNVVGIHHSTLELTHQVFAKVCIEMDVTKPFLDTLWIGPSRESGLNIPVEYEGNNSFCNYCGLLGHTVGLCRKEKQAQGKTVAVAEKENTKEHHELKKKENQQWVVKGDTDNDIAPQDTAPKVKTTTPQRVTEILKRPAERQATIQPQAAKPSDGKEHVNAPHVEKNTKEQMEKEWQDAARHALVSVGLVSESEGATTDNFASDIEGDSGQKDKQGLDKAASPPQRRIRLRLLINLRC